MQYTQIDDDGNVTGVLFSHGIPAPSHPRQIASHGFTEFKGKRGNLAGKRLEADANLSARADEK